MKVKELKDSFKKKLIIPGFKPTSQGGAICFSKKENESKYKVSIGYVSIRNSDIIHLSGGILYYKYFHEVEKLLKKYYDKYKLKYNCYTIHAYSVVKDLEKIPLSSSEDINKVVPFLELLIYEKILPFFDAYLTLEAVHEKMENLEMKDIGKFIYSPAPIRIMIIKKIINAPDFEIYSQKVLVGYEEGMKGKYAAQLEKVAQFLPELYEELTSYSAC